MANRPMHLPDGVMMVSVAFGGEVGGKASQTAGEVGQVHRSS